MLSVASDFLPDSAELGLKRLRLLLESGYGTHAAVNWVADTRVRLVDKAACGVGTLVLRHFHQHLRNIAGAEDFVDAGKFLGLMGGEVGREWTLLGASSPEEFAGSAGGGALPLAAQHLFPGLRNGRLHFFLQVFNPVSSIRIIPLNKYKTR